MNIITASRGIETVHRAQDALTLCGGGHGGVGGGGNDPKSWSAPGGESLEHVQSACDVPGAEADSALRLHTGAV